MILIYYILIAIVYIIGIIAIFLLSCLIKKYKNSLRARFFLYKNTQKYADVHFHACSFGEVKAISTLANKFDSRISVITQTGYDEAIKNNKKVSYLAFESLIPFWLKPCKVLVIFEAELWLFFVFYAKIIIRAKVLLINARISERSFKKYKIFAFLYKKIFSYIDEVYAQSIEDEKRLKILGAKNIKICGNIKASLNFKLTKNYTKLDNKLIIFASTHEKEEELLLTHFILPPNHKLIIAPRHPERFDKVFRLSQKYADKNLLSISCFTKLDLKDNDLNKAFNTNILILDTLNELINLYAIADIVVLGGSFIDGIGGHNPMEIACFNKPLITGQFIHNQKALFDNIQGFKFCKDIKNLQNLIINNNEKTYIKQNINISNIINSIQEGINERQSL